MIAEVLCGECGAPMSLRESRHGPFYGCTRYPACKGSHGAHPNGAPLGIPADAATKAARVKAHAAFDTLWKPDAAKMTRKQAYAWLQSTLGLSKDAAHIGNFTTEQCTLLIEALPTADQSQGERT